MYKFLQRGSYQFKLFFTYSIFTVIIVSMVLVTFYLYNKWLFINNSKQNLYQLVQLHSDKLDSAVREMDSTSIDVMSDPDVLKSLEDWRQMSSEANVNYINNHLLYLINKFTLNRSIFSGTIQKVKIFTDDGLFISNDRSRDLDANASRHVSDVKWLEKVRLARGSKILLALHKNDWTEGNERVFSLVRLISTPYNELGYVEIQQEAHVLEDICNFGDPQLNVFLIGSDNELFYNNSITDSRLINYYANLTDNGASAIVSGYNKLTKHSEIVYYTRSSYTGLTLVCVADRSYINRSFSFIKVVIIVSGIILIIITLIISYFFSLRLVKPLKKLRRAIEQTNISNLPDVINLGAIADSQLNEIEALGNSFQAMRERLDKAIKTEVNYRALQVEARFSVLQAQINPHFLFNMLNVLVNIGDEKGVPDISDICRRMARNLRYSNSKASSRVTLRDEIEHASDYLMLMQRRYEAGLVYNINISEELYDILVPKLVIQPLVENSLSHGFNNTSYTKEIEILGSVHEDRWFSRILDNGSGFEPELLKNLMDRITLYLLNMGDENPPAEISIGGMGLINTMARLKYFFKGEFEFELSNRPEAGACVTLSGILNKDGRQKNV